MNETGGREASVLRWNLPARISHWGFSTSLLLSLFFAYRYEPESEAFKYHILASVLCCWFLAVRIFLAVFGSHPMRWSEFFHTPRATVGYLLHALSGKRTVHSGLNPGSALFAVSVYAALVALVYTGFVADLAETWHGRTAGFTVAAIAVHLLGLALHAMRHRALTPLEMVHGRGPRPEDSPVVQENLAGGVVLLLLSLALTAALIKYFDLSASVLSIPFLPEIAFPVIQKG
jgi:cytochrome b